MAKRRLFILFFSLLMVNSYSINLQNVDTAYILKHTKKVSITLPVTTRYLVLRFTDRSTATKLTYTPALCFSHGLDIDTKWFSLSITPKLLNVNPNPEVFGRTQYRDIQLFMYPKRLSVDLFYQNYSGFYLANTQKNSAIYSNELYHKRPDMNVLTFGSQIFYILNYKKYSLAAPFGFSTQQLKSAGSFLLGISGSVLDFSSDSSIVESFYQFAISDELRLKEFRINKFGVNVGYGYTYVLKKNFFFSALLVLGGGMSNLNYKNIYSLESKYRNDASLNLNYRASIGYDNGKWYCGIYAILHQNVLLSNARSQLEYDNFKSKLYLGRRFGIPKVLDRVNR